MCQLICGVSGGAAAEPKAITEFNTERKWRRRQTPHPVYRSWKRPPEPDQAQVSNLVKWFERYGNVVGRVWLRTYIEDKYHET